MSSKSRTVRWTVVTLGAAMLLSVLLVADGARARLVRAATAFLGAGQGTAVEFVVVDLPPVAPPAGDLSGAGGGGAKPLGTVPVGRACVRFEELVFGDVVISDDGRMHQVWTELFDAPYDALQFDFDSTFVILMGGGLMQAGSFEITSVETFESVFDSPEKFVEDRIEPALAVVGTTSLSGPPPDPEEPFTYRVSAVRVDLQHLDDVIFHRAVFAPP